MFRSRQGWSARCGAADGGLRMPVPAVRSGRARDRDAAGGGDAGTLLLRRRGDRPEPGVHGRVQHASSRAASCCCRSTCRPAPPPCASSTAGTSPRAARTPPHARPRHVPARDHAGDSCGPSEFRGWGGSSHPDVTCRNEGFSTEAQYLASPRVDVPGKTTRGFIPGPIKPGQWAAELGVAAVDPAVARATPTARSAGGWRSSCSNDPAFADEPYRPRPYDTHPGAATAGLVRGRLPRARRALGARRRDHDRDLRLRVQAAREGGAGLDFITLSDYVSGRVGRDRPLPGASTRGNLIVRSAEVITYRGHTNNHASARYVDYRTGPDLRAARRRLARARSAARGRRARSSTRSTAPAAGPRSTTRRSSRRPNPFFAQLLPRLLVGLHRRRDRLLAGRRDRGRRPGPSKIGTAPTRSPLHGDRVLRARARARATRSPRSARATRTTPGAPPASCAAGAGRAGHHRGLRRPSCRRTASAAACRPTTPT